MNNVKPFTIILPCYNPQENWAQNIVADYQQITELLQTEVSIVVVNDGSSKGVSEADIAFLKAQVSDINYIQYDQNRGKGYAVRSGLTAAKTDIVIYTDIDFPYTIDSLKRIYDSLLDNTVDVAIGVKDEQYYSKVPAARKAISKILRKLIGWCFSIPITDTQCGLKGFNKKGANVFLQTKIDRYLFDLEFIIASTKSDLNLKAIPVSLKEGVSFSKMNMLILIPELYNFMSLFVRKK